MNIVVVVNTEFCILHETWTILIVFSQDCKNSAFVLVICRCRYLIKIRTIYCCTYEE